MENKWWKRGVGGLVAGAVALGGGELPLRCLDAEGNLPKGVVASRRGEFPLHCPTDVRKTCDTIVTPKRSMDYEETTSPNARETCDTNLAAATTTTSPTPQSIWASSTPA
jgi:hypothetical protein